jgi:uncharacterized protein (UPF0332 family)
VKTASIYEGGDSGVSAEGARAPQLDVMHYPDDAGRASYFAGLHAARALIFERAGAVIKRHRGVQRELGRLTKDEPSFDNELRAFLGRTYSLKAIADYGTDLGSEARR